MHNTMYIPLFYYIFLTRLAGCKYSNARKNDAREEDECLM